MNPALLTTTDAVDPVFKFIFGACLLLLGGITATMIWFVIRYRRSRAPEPTSQVAAIIWLETVWIVLPSVLVMAMFYYGWAGYLALRTVPKDALPVTATARMWIWNFTYANGRTSPKLYVPVGRPVVVDLVSADILHGFFIPAFRVKRDVVPGMKNHAWFVADKAGSYDLFCSQYCGKGHSAMITTVEALPEAEFAVWLEQKGGRARRRQRSLTVPDWLRRKVVSPATPSTASAVSARASKGCTADSRRCCRMVNRLLSLPTKPICANRSAPPMPK